MSPILPGAPWLIAHKSMLGVNQPYKITLNGRDYVLWKNSDGKVFALDNICPHRQAPLSAGWICPERETITCPFHTLEFDGMGRLYQNGTFKAQPVTQPLELTVIDDCIWTYGGYEPKTQIPDLLQHYLKSYSLVGVAGDKSIQGDFLSNLKINYDFNHQNGTHRESFQIKDNPIHHFETDGLYAQVVQEIIREDNTLREFVQNPALLTTPKVYTGTLEYAFPSLTIFSTQLPLGKIAQAHVLYPETPTTTKTFVLCLAQWSNPLLKLPGLNSLIKRSFLKAVETVVLQDTTMIEKLYPSQPLKIKLPKEEIIAYAEKLYHEW